MENLNKVLIDWNDIRPSMGNTLYICFPWGIQVSEDGDDGYIDVDPEEVVLDIIDPKSKCTQIHKSYINALNFIKNTNNGPNKLPILDFCKEITALHYYNQIEKDWKIFLFDTEICKQKYPDLSLNFNLNDINLSNFCNSIKLQQKFMEFLDSYASSRYFGFRGWYFNELKVMAPLTIH